MTTATFTDLLRSPNEVVAQTDGGAVRITRRDAADLVLMRAGDLDAQNEGIALASRIMRAALSHKGDMLGALRGAFAWTSILSARSQKEFASEIGTLVWSSAELGAYTQLREAIRSWQGTAEALADGMRPDEPLDWIDPADWRDVERPA
jgi:hypothetical protein